MNAIMNLADRCRRWQKSDVSKSIDAFLWLFDLRAISVGIIITRCDELQDIVAGLGRGKSSATRRLTWSKLLPRVLHGGGAGCPLLVFGISKKLYVED